MRCLTREWHHRTDVPGRGSTIRLPPETSNRIQRPSVLDLGHSFVRTSLAEQPDSKPRVGLSVVRIQFEGAPVFRFCFSPVPFLLQDICEHDMGFNKIRIECKRLSSEARDFRPRCFGRNSGCDRSERGIGLCKAQVRWCKCRVPIEGVLEIRNAFLNLRSVSCSKGNLPFR